MDVQLTTLAYILVSCSVSLHASQSGVFSGTGRPVLTAISIVGGDWEVRLIFIVSTDVSNESVPPRRFRSRTSAPTRNSWALEEIGRRLLEAHERGLWDADPDVLEGLRGAYLEMEGWIEDLMGDAGGDIQGGAVRVVTVGDVKALRGAREEE